MAFRLRVKLQVRKQPPWVRAGVLRSSAPPVKTSARALRNAPAGISRKAAALAASETSMRPAPCSCEWLGVPMVSSLITGLAVSVRAETSWSAVKPERVDLSRAAAPATCGAAIEVPLLVLTPVVLVMEAAMMETPGAVMSGLSTLRGRPGRGR